MAEATKRCPDLVVVPYEFDKYQQASDDIYRIFFRYTHRVMGMSLDEAYLEFAYPLCASAAPSTSTSGVDDTNSLCQSSETFDAVSVANRIRAEIQATTGCTASAGIASNMLLARLATKKAKPNGVHVVLPDEAERMMDALSVHELPGEMSDRIHFLRPSGSVQF